MFHKICENKYLRLSNWVGIFDHLLLSAITLAFILLIVQKPSVWTDEYLGGLDYLNVTNFKAFYLYILSYGPQVAPLYFFTLYLFCGKLGVPIETFRWVIVFFNIVSANFVYLIAKSLLPRKYALGVGFLFISFPIFLWNASSLRYHSITQMWAFISLYLFISYYLSKEEISFFSLVSLTLVNIFLALSHYLFVWIIGVEVFMLLLKLIKRQFIYLLPAVLNLVVFSLGFSYLVYVFYGNRFLALSLNHSFWKVLEIVFGVRDFEVPSYISWGIYVQPIVFAPNALPPMIQKICDIAPLIILDVGGGIIASILFVSFLLASYRFLKDFWAFDEKLFFIFLLAFLCPIVFATWSLLSGGNVLIARYILVCYVAKFCWLFIILSKWKPKRVLLKWFVASVILLWAFHQYLLFRVNSIYTDWEGCVRYVSENLKEDDIIICGRDVDCAVFKYNWREKIKREIPAIFTSDSLNTSLDFLVYLIKHLPPEHKICILYNTCWNLTLEEKISAIWNEYGLRYSLARFPSWEGILCYIFSVEENFKVKEESPYVEESSYSSSPLVPLLQSNLEKEFTEEEKVILARYKDFGDEIGMTNFLHMILDLINLGKSDWARIISKQFQSANSWATLGFALSEMENLNMAEEIFRKLKVQNPYFAFVFSNIWENLKRKDYLALKKESERLLSDGYSFAYVFYHLAEHKEKNTKCILPIGIFPFTTNSEEKLRDVLLMEPNKTSNRKIETQYVETIKLKRIRDTI